MVKNLFLCSFLCISSYSYGQIVSYDFENNLIEDISGFNAIYTENGSNNNSPTYTSGNTGLGILLDPIQGIYLPTSLNNQFDFNKSIEFGFDFKVTTLGNDQGRKELLELSEGWNDNSPGINIYTYKINDNNYKVMLNYSDGGYNRGVENHPGGSRNNIGSFKVGDFVKFRLILDFEKKRWTSILNNTSSSAYFDDYYDWDKIKQVILDNYIRIGWLNNSTSIAYSGYTSTILIDNLKIYSPKSNSVLSVLTIALNAMTKHVDGTSTLSESELKKYLTDIQTNYSGNFTDAKSATFEFINTYENKYDPLFKDGRQAVFSELPVEAQTLIFLQQSIFDEEYKTNPELMEGIKFEFSEVFPGKVKESALRINNAAVEINGTYNVIHGARHLLDNADAKRPTGYYAPPGELITITIPNEHLDKGISVMIGAHERDHSNLNSTNRFLRISNKFSLTIETTKILNPFGGGIYILIPEGSDLGHFEIKINGAVKSPYFSSRVGKETDPLVWQAELDEQNVSWVDIESDKFMTTLPSIVVNGIGPGSIDLPDPTIMMEKWEEVADGFNYVGGRSPERSRAEYIISDTRIPDGGYGTGYPAVYDQYDYNMMATALLKNEPHKIGGIRTMFHEMGHLEWHPTLWNSVEAIVHLPAVYIWNNYYDIPLDTAFKYSAFQNLTIDQTTIDWVITDNFRNNREMDCDPTMDPSVCHEVRYQHRGHVIYIEIAYLFGWESIHNTHKVFVDEWKTNSDKNWGFMGSENGNGISDDELILAASNSIGENMAPLFHFWGRHPSSDLLDKLKDLSLSDKIYNHLVDYKKLIPSNTSEFQPWYDANYVSVGGVQQVRYDYAINNFDADNYGPDIQAQIDLIIETYYGDGYVSVGNTNQTPSAFAQSVSTNEGTGKSITLSGSDPDGDTLTYLLASQPLHGTATLNGSTVTYTPSENYNGEDSFTFAVSDGTILSSPVAVSINVLAFGQILLDGDLADGDQEQRRAYGVVSGDVIELQLVVAGAPEIEGWSAEIDFNPTQVGYEVGSFAKSDFIPGFFSLEDLKENSIGVGGTALVDDGMNAGDGVLGTIRFMLLEGFADSTELAISSVSFKETSGATYELSVDSRFVLTSETLLVGDFNSDGQVNFFDFFLFADAFGATSLSPEQAMFDLNRDGVVNFFDFFIFADNFGKSVAKLMVLAHELLGLPLASQLGTNYPNPFNSSTTLRYILSEPGAVELSVYDVQGQRVRRLVQEVQTAGRYEITWAGDNEAGQPVATGTYFTRLQAGAFVQTRKVMLIK